MMGNELRDEAEKYLNDMKVALEYAQFDDVETVETMLFHLEEANMLMEQLSTDPIDRRQYD